MFRLLTPNLTMNLTYLCYGETNVSWAFSVKKAFRWNPFNSGELLLLKADTTLDCEKDYVCRFRDYSKIKKVEEIPPFLPQILPWT